MKLPTLLALTGTIFTAGTLLSLPTGCLACNDIGCASGFEWDATTQDASPLAPGDYLLTLTLDGEVYEVACAVVPDVEAGGTCELSGPVEGRFYVDVTFRGGFGEPVTGFHLYAVDDAATERSGGVGPREVEIALSSAGVPLLAVDYQLEYETDDDYWGDPDCGTCELSQARSETW